ncbi:Aste57867_16937 [Aphanomyces stellatus]|uniref:Aste57867_16937 protein n=1 Tax=Aphanomyces stellatus TaxID=120398 RepID=A0A485L8H0_9STRA|nr:hypothetical protein As57867_016879 [Aphanomyces stellatus]VFT93699.1 Aste57867_16937 [Aphanomyces stellatus]
MEVADLDDLDDVVELDDDPPSDGLASYDLFVKWVLQSPTATIEADGSRHWPLDMEMLDVNAVPPPPPSPHDVDSQIKLERAAVESEVETLADELFDLERACEVMDDGVAQLEDERESDMAAIEELERLILQVLQERDDAVADQFALEAQIAKVQELQQVDEDESIAQPPKFLRRGIGVMSSMSLPFGWPKSIDGKSNDNDQPATNDHSHVHREIEVHEKRLAHEKLSLAEAKSDLDTQVFSNRLLQKKCTSLRDHLNALKVGEGDAKQLLEQAQLAYATAVAKLNLVPQTMSTKVQREVTRSFARKST